MSKIVGKFLIRMDTKSNFLADMVKALISYAKVSQELREQAKEYGGSFPGEMIKNSMLSLADNIEQDIIGSFAKRGFGGAKATALVKEKNPYEYDFSERVWWQLGEAIDGAVKMFDDLTAGKTSHETGYPTLLDTIRETNKKIISVADEAIGYVGDVGKSIVKNGMKTLEPIGSYIKRHDTFFFLLLGSAIAVYYFTHKKG